MISISNISASQAKNYYYERDPLFQSNSAWFGKTAAMFGLEPGSEVDKAEFVALLSGIDPRTGEQLIADGTNGEHRAGVDLTLSAPKSFSVLSLVSGDERLLEVYQEAVSITLAYAEDNFSQVRRSIDGQKFRVDSGNFSVATFEHSQSRQNDPQLHTHAVILSISERQKDGKFVAIENRSLYENRHLLDQVFKSELAAGARELGYAITTNEKGDFDIAGVPQEVVQTFSTRRQQVLEKADELRASGKVGGLHDAEIRERATLESRECKRFVPESEIRQRWDNELSDLGTSKKTILEDAKTVGKEAFYDRSPQMTAEDYIRTAAMALTESESIFSKSQILKTAGKLSIGDVRVSELEKAFTGMLESKSLKQLNGKDGGYQGVYTTKEMYKIEKQLVAMIKNGVGRAEPLMSPVEAETAINRYIVQQREQVPEFGITKGQREAVFNILTNDSKYLVIQGDAGVGKSKSFEIVNQAVNAFAGKDVELVGLSFTGKAANELQKASGIESFTLAKFLSEKNNISSSTENALGDVPKNERMYIVDESSMLSSRDAYKLFQQAERESSKVILVGDVKQLLGVNAGKLFSDVQTKSIIDVTNMTEVLRQKTEEMKELVSDISAKRVDAAFNKLKSHDNLHQIEDRNGLIQAIVHDYTAKDNWKETLVLTNTNESRNELNHSIRQELQTQGKIGSEDYNLSVRTPKNIGAVEKHFAQSFNEGDFVFSSKAGGGLKAGLEAKVIGIDHQNHILSLADSQGNTKRYDLKEHGEKLSVYAGEQKKFSEGEKVIFLKNDTKIGVQNGLSGTIEKIDRDGNLSIKTESGDTVAFSTKNFSYIDHGAAISLHKSQGMSEKKIIYIVDSRNENMNTTNAMYTGITRAKFDAAIYTDSIDSIKEQMKIEAVKSSTLDYDKSLSKLADREKSEAFPEPKNSMEQLDTKIIDAEREQNISESAHSEIRVEKESPISEPLPEREGKIDGNEREISR